jgi:uncharacterized protein (DUF1499 family)
MGGAQADLRGAITMVRRRITEEPTSRLAIWARRLALFALAAALLGTLIMRADLLEIIPALATVAAALVLAGAAIVLAVGALIAIWREGYDGTGAAVAGMFIGLGLLAYPTYLATKAYQLPEINDITTDPANPPQLEALARVWRRGSNPATYPGTTVATQQAEAYPDVEPLSLPASPLVVYEAVYRLITKHKWRIIEARRLLPGRRDGHIEAVARTPIMGFRDDVVVRIRTEQEGARVDVRSASRYGWHDLGTNAGRITGLLEELEAAIDALPPASRSPEPPAQEAPRPSRRRR